MTVYDQMCELLAEVSKSVTAMESEYEAAKSNPDLKAILRPTVKSSLEHLRSALEYSAHALRMKHCKAPKSRENVYFPYAETESVYRIKLDSNLPRLERSCSAAADIVASVQPFKCGDDWLLKLCRQTNFNKHQGFSSQTRVNSPGTQVSIGRLATLRGGSTITFNNCSYDGKLIGNGTPVTLSDSMSDEQLHTQLGSDTNLSIRRQFDWVEFKFGDTAEDTLELIKRSQAHIAAYCGEIEPYL
ncbi:hypothetical protein WK05_13495 [Burkholderia ubonensis]|uniref:hypothetical protein n=1 Tax=Burkholderia ubonensis TaxID=101571 RepID=UPI00075384AB|nr:hypothetical protein [Burkholderia ubonensis]KVO27037.1 hypothetical protein WJ72_23395 [Burkholderia ubonensis]KVQ72285.1 hypothetical protein WK05_13495 [Burkholderia ubonensis]